MRTVHSFVQRSAVDPPVKTSCGRPLPYFRTLLRGPLWILKWIFWIILPFHVVILAKMATVAHNGNGIATNGSVSSDDSPDGRVSNEYDREYCVGNLKDMYGELTC